MSIYGKTLSSQIEQANESANLSDMKIQLATKIRYIKCKKLKVVLEQSALLKYLYQIQNNVPCIIALEVTFQSILKQKKVSNGKISGNAHLKRVSLVLF